MDLGRIANRTQPVQLVTAQLLLLVWAGFEVVVTLPWFGDRFGPWVAVLTVLRLLAAWAVANEAKIGYWLAVGTCVLSAWPLWELVSDDPGAAVRLDVLVQAALPVAVAALLLAPASRAYARVWFR